LTQLSASSVEIFRGDQKGLTFALTNGTWTPDADVNDRLVQQVNGSGATTGWFLTTANDNVETYGASGQLLSIATRAGLKQTLTYNTQGQLSAVTDPFGHALTFTYDSLSRVSTLTDPAGRKYTYLYDANSRLVSLTWPDGTSQQYVYENTSFPVALTGIIDENGSRYSTITYDSNGLAVGTTLAGGVQSYMLSYDFAAGSTTSTDALGRLAGFNYTSPLYGQARMTLESEPLSSSEWAFSAFTYDANGNVASYSDFNGNTTSYRYSPERNLLHEETRPDGRVMTITWSPTYRLPTSIVTGTQSDQRTYDSKGNLLERVLTDTSIAYSRTWTYTYNQYGQPLTATDANGNVTKYAYSNGNLTSQTDALEHITNYTYDSEGKRLTMTDPNGLVTKYAYDTRGRLISVLAGAETTSYVYDPVGNLTSIAWPSGYQITNAYDAAHRLIGIQDGFGNQISYTLDPLNNRTAEVHRNNSGTTVYSHTWTYDTLNRVAQSIGASGQTTSLTHDPNGNLLSVTDPLGNITQLAYDSINRLSQFTAADGGKTLNTYDEFDQLIGVSDPRGAATSYTIDALGDARALNSPDAGASAAVPDAVGNMVRRTDADGHPISYSYDALNRLIQVARADTGTVLDTYTYDQVDSTHTHGIGHLTSMTDPSGTTNWSYDTNGHVVKKTQTVSGLNFLTSYTYDGPSGNRLTMQMPLGPEIQYSYASGLVIGAIYAYKGVTTPLVGGLQYEPFAGPTSWTLGNGESDGRGYDLDGRITSDGVDSAVTYDPASRILGVTGTASSRTYSYDPVGRLTGLTSTTGTSPYLYQYDLNGNRVEETVGKALTHYTIGTGNNRLTSAATQTATISYTYDADGSRIGDGTNTYVYDVLERLRNGTGAGVTTTYVYNGLNQRVVTYPVALGDSQGDPAAATSSYAGSYFLYDEAGHLIGEYNAPGGLIEETVFLGDMPVAVIHTTGTYFIHSDYRNTPRQIDNASQAAVWSWDPADFGETTANQNLSGTPFSYNQRFPGQYYDGTALKNYNYFRDYDPAVGRYLE
jgi:YD repeat-containing protein